MRAVLEGANLFGAIVVVTRYFGGTKLGTGGLVPWNQELLRFFGGTGVVTNWWILMSISCLNIGGTLEALHLVDSQVRAYSAATRAVLEDVQLEDSQK